MEANLDAGATEHPRPGLETPARSTEYNVGQYVQIQSVVLKTCVKMNVSVKPEK